MMKLVVILLIALATANAGCGWRDAISCGKTVHKVFKQCYNGNMEDFDVVGCAKNSLAIYKDDNCFDCFCSLIPVVGQACEMFELNKLNQDFPTDLELEQGWHNRGFQQEQEDVAEESDSDSDGEEISSEDSSDDGEDQVAEETEDVQALLELEQGWHNRGFQQEQEQDEEESQQADDDNEDEQQDEEDNDDDEQEELEQGWHNRGFQQQE